MRKFILTVAFIVLAASMLLAQTNIGDVLAQSMNNIIYAANVAGGDIGAKINNAQAKCPSSGCTVSLQGLSGHQVVSTPIVHHSHAISIVGPGAGTLALVCSTSITGDCWRSQDTSPPGNGTVVGGFSLCAQSGSPCSWVASTAGQIGMHVGDFSNLYLHDIAIFGFGGSNGIGLWMDNHTTYMERWSLTNVTLIGSTTNLKFSNGGGTVNSVSFGYGDTHNVKIITSKGQAGMLVDGCTSGDFSTCYPPVLYHPFFDLTFEQANRGGTYKSLVLSQGALVFGVHGTLRFEDNNDSNPTHITCNANATFTGQGLLSIYQATTSTANIFIAGGNGSTGSACNWNFLGENEWLGKSNPWSGSNSVIGASNFSLGSGWGSDSPTVSVSGYWSSFTYTITTGGSCIGCGANAPTTITFPQSNYSFNGITPGVWFHPPRYECKQVGGTGNIGMITGENGATAASMVLRNSATPAAGKTYIVTCNAQP